MTRVVKPNPAVISLRLPERLASRIDAWWRAEMERESGVRCVSRNEAIARLIDAGLIAMQTNSNPEPENPDSVQNQKP